MNRAFLLASSFVLAGMFTLPAADQPQWGEAWSRNMVSGETKLPAVCDPKSGQNVKWVARLGTETYATPIVADGKVYIGTNNGEPRDPNNKADCGVLMCFDAESGRFLWQLAVPKREEDPYFDWPKTGMSSPVTIEKDRIYYVNNRGEVVCLDSRGKITNDGHPPIVWKFDLTTGAGIWSHDAAHSSILIRGDLLYLNSGTGVDNTHKKIRTPDAPCLVVLDKRTGHFVARDNEHIAPNIFHNTWSSPSLARIDGREILFLAAGNGIVYGFQPVEKQSGDGHLLSLQKLFEYDFDPAAPKENIHAYNSNRQKGPSNFYSMPVVYKSRLYQAGGGDLWWGKNEASIQCIDPAKIAKSGTNALLWSYPLQKHVLSTPAIKDGLLFIADCGRSFYCLDADTGHPFWTHEIKGDVWASPLCADGKVYLGTRAGMFYVVAAEKEKKVLGEFDFGSPISGTATAANHTLFVATMTQLFALHVK